MKVIFLENNVLIKLNVKQAFLSIGVNIIKIISMSKREDCLSGLVDFASPE